MLSYLLPLVPKDSLAAVNNAGNTPLHWAALNGHLETLRLLVPALPKTALFLKNQFGRTPLSEAEANAPPAPESEQTEAEAIQAKATQSSIPKSKQMECAGYLLTFMELENDNKDKPDDRLGSNSASTGARGTDADGEEEVTVGVARMGVASTTGGFEYEETKTQ